MPSKLNLKTYKGKLIELNPNLNNGTFPTVQQVDKMFKNHKNALSQVFRIEIENPNTFTQTTFVMNHAKARGVATDYDVKELHCGAIVQIQGYYNSENDLHTAIGIQAIKKQKRNTAPTSAQNINQSSVAMKQSLKASMSNAQSNTEVKKLVEQKASESIAQYNSTASYNANSNKSSFESLSNPNPNKITNSSSTKPKHKYLNKIEKNINDLAYNNSKDSNSLSSATINNKQHNTQYSKQDILLSNKNKLQKSTKNLNSSINSNSISNVNKIQSSNANSISKSESSISSTPNEVIKSAMKQAQNAGYKIPSFDNDKSINNLTSSMYSSSSYRKNKSKDSRSNDLNSFTDSQDRNNQVKSKASPTNFLPQNSQVMKASSSSKSSQSIHRNKQSSAIDSIANKYHVPVSMATIKYKIVSSKAKSKAMSLSASTSKSTENKALNKKNQKVSTTTSLQSESNKHVVQKSNKDKASHIKREQQHYKDITNKDTNTLKQLKKLQKESQKNDINTKDIPTTKEITEKVQKNTLPTEHLTKHGKKIRKAYLKVMNSKNMTTTKLDDELRDIYQLEGWDKFFKDDTKSFMIQLKNDVNRILQGKSVTYPLSYNNIPDTNNFEKLLKLQKQQNIKSKDKKGD